MARTKAVLGAGARLSDYLHSTVKGGHSTVKGGHSTVKGGQIYFIGDRDKICLLNKSVPFVTLSAYAETETFQVGKIRPENDGEKGFSTASTLEFTGWPRFSASPVE